MRRIPERAKRELIRGENARAEFDLHAQNQIKRVLDAEEPTRHVEGLGQKLCTIGYDLAARLRVKYGTRCLYDIEFVRALLRDNPFLRCNTAPARLTVRVDGLRDDSPAPARDRNRDRIPDAQKIEHEHDHEYEHEEEATGGARYGAQGDPATPPIRKSGHETTGAVVSLPLVLLLALVLVIVSSSAQAYTANNPAKTVATDGTLSDTQSAVDYVAGKNQDGWVITAGEEGGTYDYNADFLNLSIAHQVTLDFANSTIRSTYNGSKVINLTVTNGKTVTLKNLHVAQFVADDFIRINGSGVDTYRLTNIDFTHATGDKAVEVGNAGGGGTLTTGADGPYGVIDHCTINGGGAGFYFYGVGANWERAMTWGTTSTHAVEDCTFTAPADSYLPAIDGWNGSRYLVRHCTFTNYFVADHGADTAGLLNSALQHEIYDNTFTATFGYDRFIFIRGGTARIRGNTYGVSGDGYINQAVKTAYFRADGTSNPPTAVDRTYPGDYVGTMQPGSGATPEVLGSDPLNLLRAWGSVPIHYWGNTLNCSTNYGEITTSNSFVYITRDIILSAPEGHTELAYPHPLTVDASPTPTPTPTPTATPSPSPSATPIFTVKPKVTGPLHRGQTLSLSQGTFSGTPLPAKTYQWQRCDENGAHCADIPGATQSTYRTRSADFPAGRESTFRCRLGF